MWINSTISARRRWVPKTCTTPPVAAAVAPVGPRMSTGMSRLLSSARSGFVSRRISDGATVLLKVFSNSALARCQFCCFGAMAVARDIRNITMGRKSLPFAWR